MQMMGFGYSSACFDGHAGDALAAAGAVHHSSFRSRCARRASRCSCSSSPPCSRRPRGRWCCSRSTSSSWRRSWRRRSSAGRSSSRAPSRSCWSCPPYRVPTLRQVWLRGYGELREFLHRARSFIILGTMGVVSSPTSTGAEGLDTWGGQIDHRQFLQPVMAPIGIDPYLTLALIFGFIARKWSSARWRPSMPCPPASWRSTSRSPSPRRRPTTSACSACSTLPDHGGDGRGGKPLLGVHAVLPGHLAGLCVAGGLRILPVCASAGVQVGALRPRGGAAFAAAMPAHGACTRAILPPEMAIR